MRIQEYLLLSQTLYLQVQLVIEQINHFFNKAPANNDINELLSTIWTPMVGFKYPTNKQGLGMRG